ncbi:MAG: hypothetical protein ACLPX8_10290 [Bryobacteraceae bacterium]|jgi:hypothetical protein
MATQQPKRPGPSAGHPGWGGRPRGVTMPCDWCKQRVTSSEMRAHFTHCPKRPRETAVRLPRGCSLAQARKPLKELRHDVVAMPCGWGCGMKLTARKMREHFTACRKRPGKRSKR